LSQNSGFEALPLGKGIEDYVVAVTEQLRKLRFLIGGGKNVNFAAEFFMSEAGFIQGTGSDTMKVLADKWEHAEHGKAFKRHDDFAPGASLDAVQNLQVAFQGRFINNIARGRDPGKIYFHLIEVTLNILSIVSK
jgi:hypothetical protein